MSPGSSDPNLTIDVFNGGFPEGLRVLVVDEDPHYLLTMENQLKEFKYQVTKCNGLAAALSLLRGSKNGHDIVIVDVQDLNAERSEFFSQIRSETDIPIIIMSTDDSVESVIEGVRKGACDYLVKPIRPEVLRTIYKHVAKKALERAEEEKGEVSSSCFINPKKKKTPDEEHDDDDHVHGRVSKKRRVIWSTDLHRQFLDAVNQLGVDKAVPKKILEIMNDESLTRENVASHLQKYRMYLKRQEEERENMKRPLLCPPDRNYYSAPPSLSGNTSTRLMYPQQMHNPTSAMANPYPRPRLDQVPHLHDGLNPQRVVSAYPQISMNHHHVLTHPPPPPLGQPALFDRVSVAVPGLQNIGNGSSNNNMETNMNLVGNHEEDSEMTDSFFQGNAIDWNLDDIGLDPIIEPPLPIPHDLSSLLHNAEACAENDSQYFDPQPHSISPSSDQMIPKSEFQGANQQENFNGGFNVNGYYMKK